MKLLKKVETHYFRSLYHCTLPNLAHQNVIFGRNDSGKSNLLRALNLFFNDESEFNRHLDFEIDLSDIRRQQAREGKTRQFIWVKITFSVPENYVNSLGEEISIKRQWNRDGVMNETVHTKNGFKHNSQRLTRFLNDIDFTYIPAVKGLDVFGDLIERIYSAAAGSSNISEATDSFIGALGNETRQLTNQLGALFGGPARFSEPTDMSEIFRTLDISHGQENHSLLRQKGDGIKARHIPELLRYINETEARSRFYIWGFEEPENSLDLGAAAIEAQRFREFSLRDDTQIFLTTHSPAFYQSSLTEEAEIRRFFISKQRSFDGGVAPSNAAQEIDTLDQADDKMQEAGLLQLPTVIRHIEYLNTQLDNASQEAAKLRRKLAELQNPTLFVEGKSDIPHLDAAFARLGVGDEISVKEMSGSAKKDASAIISNLVISGGFSANNKALLLFDNDNKGREALKKVAGLPPDRRPQASIFAPNLFAWSLAITDEFKDFIDRHSIPVNAWSFPIEFCFPAEPTMQVCLNIANKYLGKYDDWRLKVHGDYFTKCSQETYLSLQSAEEHLPDWFFARGVPSGLKVEMHKVLLSDQFDPHRSHIDVIAKEACELLLG